MSDFNHYDTLKVSAYASQAEIKQAYRRLVKIFHPDSNKEIPDNEQIIRVNAAYEVLSDNKSRLDYDEKLRHRQQKFHHSRQKRTESAQQHYKATRKTGKDVDEKIEEWLCRVYKPVNRILCTILNSLKEQIEELAADPFDDDLLDEFQDYLESCREDLKDAQIKFRSLPNPPSFAATAAHIYYCMSQLGDGIEELAYFPLSYDDRYLHTGQELFRIAKRLYREAQESVG
ncbi:MULTISPECIES: J domain-containing protein [unclassified Anabaena]|uniref:J domain-containing protein n=1 Tax=unclassified Anabaena TaxID=2619674 RepID=UPI0014455E81|nr:MULTISPECIES: J domain-containing protein [unclassified Anabaena]MTJ06959.1 J domain-containing protein [Anabaena sp. UHCC 0204]MTJ52122.1 J domain-containing protein [Anabaena sp. UHCC 0253]